MSCGLLKRIFTSRDNLFVIEARTLHIIRLIGEGSYSVVYLVKDLQSREFFALKKILSQDVDQLREAEWEIEVFKSFKHPNILNLVDCEISPSRKIPNGKEILMLMPYYEYTLQGEINVKAVTKQHFSEHELLNLFVGICNALLQFHNKKPTSWAHRDIKPNNILLSKDKLITVLADFGSVAPARIEVKSRQQALKIQDDAQNYCTPQYRAPELFDVPSNCIIDERIDIWSLGCTLYCMAFLKSPFDDAERNGSIALAVQNGKINIPPHFYSNDIVSLIMLMLNRSPTQRPFISDVIQCVKNIQEQHNLKSV